MEDRRIYRGPTFFNQQPEVIHAQDPIERDRALMRLQRFRQEVRSILRATNISMMHCEGILKSPESIQHDTQKKGYFALLDIYAVDVVIADSYMVTAMTVIAEHWPMPEQFHWGIPTTRNETNSRGHNHARGVHMNVMLDDERIGEIRLFTVRQYKAELISREADEKLWRSNSQPQP